MIEVDKVDRRKSPEVRAAARVRALAQWTPEARAAQSALTREKLQSPEVRERTARRREGQLVLLREAWRQADYETRATFIGEIAAMLAKAATS